MIHRDFAILDSYVTYTYFKSSSFYVVKLKFKRAIFSPMFYTFITIIIIIIIIIINLFKVDQLHIYIFSKKNIYIYI